MIYYLYKITNLCNGKIYIGIHTSNSLDDGYMGSGKLIKAAIRKYGKENFTKEIIEIFCTEEQMIRKEEEIVTPEFVLEDSNYNIMPGGKFGSLERNGLSFKGKKHITETIEKIRASSTGRTHSIETKIKLSENNFSRNDPIKQKEHARQAGSYSKSTEHRKKISEAITAIHREINPNLGKIRPKVECPHCGKQGAMNTMQRWHFNNCSNGG